MRYLGIIPFSHVVTKGAGFGYPCSCMLKSKLHTHGGAVGKESTCQCRRRKRHGFDPWVWKIPLRKEHPSVLAWRIPWTEESGRPQSMGSQSQTQLSSRALEHTHIHTLLVTCYGFYILLLFFLQLAYINLIR